MTTRKRDNCSFYSHNMMTPWTNQLVGFIWFLYFLAEGENKKKFERFGDMYFYFYFFVERTVLMTSGAVCKWCLITSVLGYCRINHDRGHWLSTCLRGISRSFWILGANMLVHDGYFVLKPLQHCLLKTNIFRFLHLKSHETLKQSFFFFFFTLMLKHVCCKNIWWKILITHF